VGDDVFMGFTQCLIEIKFCEFSHGVVEDENYKGFCPGRHFE